MSTETHLNRLVTALTLLLAMAGITFAAPLFPLRVGYRVVYRMSDATPSTWGMTYECTEEVTYKSQKYSLLQVYNYEGAGQYEQVCVRSTEGALYGYNPTGDDYMEFQAASVGTKWIVNEPHNQYNYLVIEIGAIEAVTVPAGTYGTAYKHHKYRCVDWQNLALGKSPERDEWIVAGVGVVKVVDDWADHPPLVHELVSVSKEYAPADLAGTWYDHALASQPGAPWWEYGPISVDSNGNFGGTVLQYGSSPDTMAGQFQIDPNGVMTIVGAPQNPTANGFHHSHMSADKSVIAAVGTWSTGVPGTSDMAILTRQGSNYQTADLAGTWYLHGLFSGSGDSNGDWMSGSLVVQSNGSFSGTVGEHDQPEAVSGQLQISPNGVITLVGSDADDHITMAANKNIIAMVTTSGDQSSGPQGEMTIWTRAAAAYQTSDLAGTWYVHALASGPGAPWWLYGRLDVMPDGSWTGTQREKTDTADEAVQGQFQIDGNGVVTFGVSYPNVNHGHMSADKNVIVIGETWQSGAPGTANLIVLTRSTASTAGLSHLHDWNGDGFVSIIGDVPPFVQCVYFNNCTSGVDTIGVGDCNHDGILSIIGDVPCFVECVYFQRNCPE